MKPHVLVVDDSLIVRMDLRGALMAAGFEVTACSTKQTAEELLEARRFDALVLDVVLPDGDGLDILRRARSDAKHVHAPIIMLSSEADVGHRVRGLSTGADEYVGKPYNIAYFIRRLRELCQETRSSQPQRPSIVGCRKILAVDDSPTFLDYIAQMLRQDGHDVVLAHSGREALDMLAAQTVDCVVLDLQMPDVDGLETVRRIRQTPGCESTPTLLLTASEDPAHEQSATAAGVDGFLRKSVSFDVVRTKIRSLLRGRRTDPLHSNDRSSSTPPNPGRVTPSEPGSGSKPFKQRHADSSALARPTFSARIPANELSPVFVEAALAMGLHGQLARETLAKTLGRLDIDPRTMDRDDLTRALPAIRQALMMFFPAEDVAPRVDALAALAAGAR